jgi:hypothetical protein
MTVEHEQRIQSISDADLALGHKIQDVLEQIHGMESDRSRAAAKTVVTVVANHLNTLAAACTREGFVQCAAAIRFEAESFFAG